MIVCYQLGKPEAVLNPKKKIFEAVQPLFKTSSDLVACWNGIPFMTASGPVKATTVKNGAIS